MIIFFFFSVYIFIIFVVPRAVTKYETGIMNCIFCKQGAVICALASANAIDLNILCTLWLNSVMAGNQCHWEKTGSLEEKVLD